MNVSEKLSALRSELRLLKNDPLVLKEYVNFMEMVQGRLFYERLFIGELGVDRWLNPPEPRFEMESYSQEGFISWVQG